MNATELADEYTHNVIKWDEAQLFEWCSKAAAMLRQQQERLTKYELRHAEQRKRIDELEAYQKHDVELAEAVGWDKGYEAGRQLGMKQERALWELAASTQEIMDTHPVELTDEEIGQFKGEWYRGDYASFYDLVRAILKKASEK